MRPEPQAFAKAWVAAWNAHDLEAILSHYAEDVVFVSPYSSRFTGDPSGRVIGKAALRDYWGKALPASELRFELRGVYDGPDGVAIRYHSSRTDAEAVEVMRFGDDGLVRDSAAFYE
ncbi:nuclear transport factor 2 family protein [Phenylobacterium soli]|uniref:nuclear transport factor 2 family protein n=1 Tax=Phenylobacterium soli TaxID=2170551 RepID=UPI001403EC68|nr:nuclear transport factor 2 family protein [Phenylobacterium soli]